MYKPTNEHLDALFAHHAPSLAQIARYEAIRRGARLFAQILVDNTPWSPDQSVALRQLRSCVMTANAAIALEHLTNGELESLARQMATSIVDSMVKDIAEGSALDRALRQDGEPTETAVGAVGEEEQTA